MQHSEIQQMKLKLIEWVIRQESAEGLQSVINQVNNFDKNLEDSSKLVGFRSNGLRVHKEQLVILLQEALDQYESGNVKSIEDFEKESELW